MKTLFYLFVLLPFTAIAAENGSNFFQMPNCYGFPSLRADFQKQEFSGELAKLDSTDKLLAFAQNEIRFQQRCDRAELAIRRAIELADKAGNTNLRVDISPLLAILLIQQRRKSEFDKFARELILTWGEASTPNIQRSIIYSKLSEVSFDNKNFEEAVNFAERALEIAEKVKVPDSFIAVALEDLASVYVTQMRFKDANAAHARAIGLRKRTNMMEPPRDTKIQEIVSLYKSGDVSAAIGLASKAVSDQEEKLRISQNEVINRHKWLETLTANSVATANVDGVIPQMTKVSQHRDQTEAQRALKLAESSARNQGHELSELLTNLAELHHSQKQYAKAEEFYKKALQNLDLKATTKLRPLADLGTLYRTQARYSEAEKLQKEAFNIVLPIYGSEHPDVVESQTELAFVLKAQGKFDEAEPLYISLLAAAEKQTNTDFVLVSELLNALGEMSVQREKYQIAEGYYQKAISKWDVAAVKNTTQLNISLNNLASVYRKTNRTEELKIVEQRLSAFKPIPTKSENKPETVTGKTARKKVEKK